MESRIDKQEIVDTYSALIDRLWRKKDALLASANHVVELTEGITQDNYSASIGKIKKEMNVMVECLSELRPHAADDRLIILLYGEATRLLALSNLTEKTRKMVWPTLKHEFQQFCQFANELSLKPTKKSLETALGIKIGNQWFNLQGSLDKKVSNH